MHARDSHGSTPLHFASSSGHVDSVGVLLDAEAVVDTADAYERTPLYYAIFKDRDEAAILLIDRGASVSYVDLLAIPAWCTTSLHHGPIVDVSPSS
jgi:ankyrin repeat protein